MEWQTKSIIKVIPVPLPNRRQTIYNVFNTLRRRQNGRHFPDDIFKCIFLNENVSIAIKISLKFVAKDPINHIPALVQIMAWRRPGDKPLSEPTMISLPTHICVTRPQTRTVCFSLQNGVLWDMGLVNHALCATGLFSNNSLELSIVKYHNTIYMFL